MSSNPIIWTKDISKCYSMYADPRARLWELCSFGRKKYHTDFWALKGVSLEVQRGDAVGLIGVNGSGKSTFLQIVAGVLRPSSGNFNVQGRVSSLLELGAGYNPEFSGRSNVYMNGALMGFNRAQMDERLKLIEEFAGIGEFIDRPVKTYSSGMYIRLAFAAAINVDPDILIVDEALAVGDMYFQHKCFKKIQELKERGVTILLASHDLESVRTLCNRAIMLDRGEVRAAGLPRDVVHIYARQVAERESQEAKDYSSAQVEAVSPAESDFERQYGSGAVRIVDCRVENEQGEPIQVYEHGSTVRIRVKAKAFADVEHLNFSLRVRSKKGAKIYSWGTLNHENSLLARGEQSAQPVWGKKFSAGSEIDLLFTFPNRLGPEESYSVSFMVTRDDNRDFGTHKILHWVDDAVVFSSRVDRKKYFFGGMVDLEGAYDLLDAQPH